MRDERIRPAPLPQVLRTRWPQRPGSPLRLHSVTAGAAPLLCAELSASRPSSCVVVITPDPGRAEQFMQQVAWLGGNGNGDGMALLPDRETLPYDLFSPHPEITSRRLETLTRLLEPEASRMPETLFVAAPTLLERLPPRSQFRQWLGFPAAWASNWIRKP